MNELARLGLTAAALGLVVTCSLALVNTEVLHAQAASATASGSASASAAAASASAAAPSAPPTSAAASASARLSPVLTRVANAKAELKKLGSTKTTEGDADTKPSVPSRFVRYGVSVGVAATLYTPGFGGNTLTSVAGGAMPYVGLFPGYWFGSSGKNAYCSVQWSAPGDDALRAGKANEKNETPSDQANGAGQKDPEQVVQETDEAVAKAKESIAAADEAEQKAKNGGADAPKKADDAPEKADDPVKKADDAVKKADEKQKELEELLRSERLLRSQRSDRRYLKGSAHRAREVRDEAQEKLKEALKPTVAEKVSIPAMVGVAERTLRAKGITSSAAADAMELCSADVEKDVLLNGVDGRRRKTIGLLACTVALIELDLLELDKREDGFRGEETNCIDRKWGFYFGYPGMFDATTEVDSRTAVNRVRREVTPLLSHGLVFSPNALVGLTAGVWVGTTDIAPDHDVAVWGFNTGLAITGDVFNALAD